MSKFWILKETRDAILSMKVEQWNIFENENIFPRYLLNMQRFMKRLHYNILFMFLTM